MHMKELPICSPTIYGWVACMQPATKSIILSSYQHCDEHATISNTLMCILHNYSSIKSRFSHIQALLLDYILALAKKYAYALHASCFYIEVNIFEHFKTKYTTKSTSVS